MVELRITQDDLKWLFLSFIFVSLAIFFSYYIFPSQTSILSISFVVIALTPYLYRAMEKEEVIVARSTKGFFHRYDGIITKILVLSLGLFLSFSFWYNVLPSDPSYTNVCSTALPCREGVFHLQSNYNIAQRSLNDILGLMFLSFILSLLLGIGALLIITWDLSYLVVGSSLGQVGVLEYLPQLFAFFLTGLAGALLSFAVIKHEWRSHAFLKVVRDSLALLALSVLIVLIYPFLFYTT